MKSLVVSRCLFILTVLCLMAALTDCAQKPGAPQTSAPHKFTKSDLPAAVLSAFQNQYPNAVINACSQEKQKDGRIVYEIESTDGPIGRDLIYQADGTVLDKEETMSSFDDLPDLVKAAVRNETPQGICKKIECSVHGQTTTYELVLEEGTKAVSMEVTSDGKVLEKGRTFLAPVEIRESYKNAVKLQAAGEYEKAIQIYQDILKVLDEKFPEESKRFKSGCEYNAACAYSLLKKIDPAIEYLKKSVKDGFKNYTHMKQDADLDNIRNDPRYKNIIEAGTNKPGENEEEE